MLPPAIALFSSILKREGHDVRLFDATYYNVDYGIDSDGTKMEHLNVVPYDMQSRGIKQRTTPWREDIRALVDDFSPDLVAVSSTEDMWELGVQILEGIQDKITRDRIPVIVGGVFATFAPHLPMRHPLVDMVCVGEGENAMVDLCKRIETGSAYDDVTNLWVKQSDGSIRKNLVSKPVDVNESPYLDLSLFEDERLYRPMAGKIYRMLPIETARGCPFSCAFCNSPNQVTLYQDLTNANFFRKKRMELVHSELKFLKDSLNIEYNYFWADTFLALNKKEFDEFCEMYSDIRLPFWIQTRPETITDYKVKRLKDVGLHRISFGLEHGNEAFRAKYLDRQFKNEDILEKLRVPVEYDVSFSVNNITGFPHETRELAMDTVELNRQIGSSNQNIYSFTPFHGTPLRKMCEDMGLIHPDTVTKSLTDKPMLNLPGYPVEEIEGLKKCFALYVKFPKNRWDEIRLAEADTEEGNRIFETLKAEYIDRYLDLAAPEIHETADLEYGAINQNEISTSTGPAS